jgi:hypothetical protein
VAAKERKKSEGLVRQQQQIVEVLDCPLTREVKIRPVWKRGPNIEKKSEG